MAAIQTECLVDGGWWWWHCLCQQKLPSKWMRNEERIKWGITLPHNILSSIKRFAWINYTFSVAFRKEAVSSMVDIGTINVWYAFALVVIKMIF